MDYLFGLEAPPDPHPGYIALRILIYFSIVLMLLILNGAMSFDVM